VLYFSDPRVMRVLREHFIPLAVDCEQTERTRDDSPMTRLCAKVIKQRDPTHFSRLDPSPTQGFYVFGASGRLYAAANYEWLEEKATNMLALLKRARAAHAEQADKSAPLRALSQHPAPPPGTLVARTYTRIRPMPSGAAHINYRVGYDFLWLPRHEVQALCRGEWPASLTRRLTLGQLRDNIRGEPRRFRLEGVKQADFRATARLVDGKIRVRLAGKFHMTAPSLEPKASDERSENMERAPACGFRGTLEGELIFDKASNRVERFLLYASGMAWGRHPHTPGAPPGKYPLKIVAVLAQGPKKDPVAWKLPPFSAGYDKRAIARYLSRGEASR